MPSTTTRRLVIVVRADPVICGHSGEARNLAEAALDRGFDDVRIVTWPIDALGALPLKPMDRILPYSRGITVERPGPVGSYKVVDSRYTLGVVGRLVELFTDGVPTLCIALYLTPHANAVMEARRVATALGRPVPVTTVAEAVGSDITDIVRRCVADGRTGAAVSALATFLGHDHCVAVSKFTKHVIVAAAAELDTVLGTDFAARCEQRVEISYPAVDAAAFWKPAPAEVAATLTRRGLVRDGYALFLSRLTPAKGVDDLIDGYAASGVSARLRLVIAGTGPEAGSLRDRAAATGLGDRIVFFDDVDDSEKSHLMAGSTAYLLPSKPMPEFTETFGIALVEKMVAGGGPVVTTSTGGIPEAVGDTAIIVPSGTPASIAGALRQIVAMSPNERSIRERAARDFAMQFDRARVLDKLLARIALDDAPAPFEVVAS